MSDVVVPPRSTTNLGRVEGELKVGRNARIKASEGKSVVVTEGAYFEGAAELDCDFDCDSLRLEGGGKLRVNGNLTVRNKLDIGHSIDAIGFIKAGEIDVGGRVHAKSLECKKLRVGGIVEVEESLSGEVIDVGGKVKIMGQVQIVDLQVGGLAEVGGGSITGNIRIGGKFASSARLDFGNLDVYGQATLPPKCTGQSISTYGKLSVMGELECQKIDIEGVADIHGSCKSSEIAVNGKLEVQGNLETSDKLEISGSADILGEFKSSNLRIGGKFRAPKAVVRDEVDIFGEAETSIGLRGGTVTVRSGSRCRGPIIGDRVEIGSSKWVVSNWDKKWAGQSVVFRLVGKMTKVEDIYAKEVYLSRYSRSARVFAGKVQLEDGVIAEEIHYTGELVGSIEHSYMSNPPRKVSELPTPPIPWGTN